MRKTLLIIGIIALFSLTGCSNGVSQDDYQAVVAENEELKKKNEELEQIRTDLEAKALDESSQKAVEKMEKAYPVSWAKTCFGDDTIYLTDNPKYMQCIVAERYSSSADSITNIWENFKNSCSLLGTLEGNMNYEKIAVKYLAEDDTTLIEFVLRKEGSSFTLDSISGNLTKADILVASLSSK